MNLAALLGSAVLVFASTNIDDIFVLLGFLTDPHFQLRNVAVGQYLGIGVLVVVSVAASLVSLVFAPEYVGLLGLLPVLIGVIRLFTLLRARGKKDAQHHEARSGSIGQIASVAAVTMANGGDNIGIYTPLFATQTASATAVIVIVTLGAPIRRYGHIAVPFVLIGLGIYILRAPDRSN